MLHSIDTLLLIYRAHYFYINKNSNWKKNCIENSIVRHMKVCPSYSRDSAARTSRQLEKLQDVVPSDARTRRLSRIEHPPVQPQQWPCLVGTPPRAVLASFDPPALPEHPHSSSASRPPREDGTRPKPLPPTPRSKPLSTRLASLLFWRLLTLFPASRLVLVLD
jgi:hypothetical protein